MYSVALSGLSFVNALVPGVTPPSVVYHALTSSTFGSALFPGHKKNGYGYLIDVLGARIIQTDRPQFLLDYLRSRNLHD